MIRVYCDKDTTITNYFWVEFYSKYNYYQILGFIKQFPYKKVKRSWRLPVEDVLDLLLKFSAVKGDTVHVDFQVLLNFYQLHKANKKLLELRYKLNGIDSGVKLVEPYQLLPFQHVGIEFGRVVKNIIIADKVGLGKTVQGFGIVKALYQDGVIKKSFIVVPATLKLKWQRDIKNLLGEDSQIYDGTPAKRKNQYKEWMDGDCIFLIVSYDTLRIDWGYIKTFIPKPFSLTFDEVQKLKNKRTSRSAAMKEISNHAMCKSRVGLSATYIETGLQDMFGSMYIIDETVFGGNFMSFADKYLEISYMGKIIGATKVGVKLARDKMKLHSVRRRKPQVVDQLRAKLPKVTENTLWLELSKIEKAMYNEILAGVVDKIDDMEKKGQVSRAIAMTQMQLLQQAVLSTDMFGYNKSVSTKIDTLVNILPEIVEENKVLIFCHFTKFIDFLEKALMKNGLPCYAMHGKRQEGSGKNRQLVVDKFSASKTKHILIASDLLAEGVDVPAASYIINTDILWNPAKLTQRAGRIDRLNTKADNLYIINLWAKGSIEESMYEVVYERYNLALDVMDDGIEEGRIEKFKFSDIKKMLTKMH